MTELVPGELCAYTPGPGWIAMIIAPSEGRLALCVIAGTISDDDGVCECDAPTMRRFALRRGCADRSQHDLRPRSRDRRHARGDSTSSAAEELL